MVTLKKTPADQTARESLKKMATESLLTLWELTMESRDPNIPTVRGWLMDELEARNPEGFERWLDGEAEDSTLRDYILRK